MNKIYFRGKEYDLDEQDDLNKLDELGYFGQITEGYVVLDKRAVVGIVVDN